MAFEITSDTVVKILIRRGEELDRKLTLLSNGELGYSQDINRLFIGDGFTLGGKPVSNIFHGFTNSYNDFTDISQTGDTIYQTSDNTLYALDGETWRQAGPLFGGSFIQLQNPDAKWFIDPVVFSPAFTYSPLGPDNNSIGRYTNRVDFNKNFLSLSGQSTYGSFYFGDWDRKTVNNSQEATVNVVNRIYVHDEDPNPFQLQIHARSAADGGSGTIKTTRGPLFLKAVDELSLFTDSFKHIQTWDGSYVKVRHQTLGTHSQPNFDVDGYTRFRNSIDVDNDLTVTGNLSVYGEMSYFETFVTTTSAITAINRNLAFTGPVLQVSQLAATDNQIVARFDGHSSDVQNGRPIMTVWDGPFVGINTPMSQNASSTPTVNFVVSGGAGFGYTPENTATGFRVNAGTGGIRLNSRESYKSVVLDSYEVTSDGLNSSVASHYTIESNADSNTTGLKFKNNQPGTSKIAIEARSSDIGRGLWIIPDASAGAYNGLVQANDTAVIATAGAVDQGDLVLGIWSSGTKGMRIDQDGNVSINTASAGGNKFKVSGTVDFTSTLVTAGKITGNGGADIVGNLTVTSGNIRCSQDIIAYYSSDSRLKKNVKIMSSALEKIDQISGVEFDWDSDLQEAYTGHDIGVLAQEIESVLPEAVITREDGFKAVKYEKIIPLLIEAIKELKRKVK